MIKNILKPGLYVVPTPIGNLEDITLRALNTLKSVDVIYCEDTRVSSKLLSHFSISKPLRIYNDHSSEADRIKIMHDAQEKAIALISDAGTPLISDPGFKLIQDIQRNNIYYTVLPGANAVITGLVLSGFCTTHFSFCGFFDIKKIKDYQDIKMPLVFFESPHDVLKTLESLKDLLKDRKIALCRELTKLFEEVTVGTIEDVLNDFKNRNFIKGEFVIVLSEPEKTEISDQIIEDALRDAFTHLKGKDAVQFVADQLSIAKKRVYSVYLRLNQTSI
ncbi:MAG: 16S rRNA (cytidine(1402)-2'-O)-methyltransferase [Proteobacteria bacterium]|nr:16S rRNA (cytidine(1402)-2'-O)-methyltransferase [Pseudomonadota bacterium]